VTHKDHPEVPADWLKDKWRRRVNFQVSQISMDQIADSLIDCDCQVIAQGSIVLGGCLDCGADKHGNEVHVQKQ
jgi:hypothetical protein